MAATSLKLNLITPADLAAMFPENASIAFIGNSTEITTYTNGRAIDDHDIVVRFNRASVDGLEENIGSRTDILCVNASNTTEKAPPPSQTTKPRVLVSFVTPENVHKLPWEGFAEWADGIPTLLSFGVDMLGVSVAPHTRPFTTGTYAIFSLTKLLQAETLFLTGFTMFGAQGGSSKKYYADKQQDPGNFHDLDAEAKTFRSLLERSGVSIKSTPELSWAFDSGRSARSGDQSDRKGIKQRLAASASWRLLNLAMKLRRVSEQT